MTPLLCFSITACLFWYAQVTAQLILPRARTHISKKGRTAYQVCGFQERSVRMPADCTDVEDQSVNGCNYLVSWSYKQKDYIEFQVQFRSKTDRGFVLLFVPERSNPAQPTDGVLVFETRLTNYGYDLYVDEAGAVKLDKKLNGSNNVDRLGGGKDAYSTTVKVKNVKSLQFTRDRDTGDSLDVVFDDETCYYFKFEFAIVHGFEDTLTFMKDANETTNQTDDAVCVRLCDEFLPSISYTFSSAIELRDEVFTVSYLNARNSQYQKLQREVEKALRRVYYNFPLEFLGRVQIKVKSFSPGSIIVNYEITATYNFKFNGTRETFKKSLLRELNIYLMRYSNKIPPFSNVYLPEQKKDDKEEQSSSWFNTRWLVAFVFVGLAVIMVVGFQAAQSIQKSKKNKENYRRTKKKSHKFLYRDISLQKLHENIVQTHSIKTGNSKVNVEKQAKLMIEEGQSSLKEMLEKTKDPEALSITTKKKWLEATASLKSLNRSDYDYD